MATDRTKFDNKMYTRNEVYLNSLEPDTIEYKIRHIPCYSRQPFLESVYSDNKEIWKFIWKERDEEARGYKGEKRAWFLKECLNPNSVDTIIWETIYRRLEKRRIRKRKITEAFCKRHIRTVSQLLFKELPKEEVKKILGVFVTRSMVQNMIMKRNSFAHLMMEKKREHVKRFKKYIEKDILARYNPDAEVCCEDVGVGIPSHIFVKNKQDKLENHTPVKKSRREKTCWIM